MQNLNVSVLVEAINNYLTAENEYKLFLTTWTGGWWEDKTAKEREYYTKHTERSSLTYDTVHMMCRLINVDVDGVIAMVKAINRWEKHGGKWDRDYCIHIDYQNEIKVMRFITKDDGWGTRYYNSIGRKISA